MPPDGASRTTRRQWPRLCLPRGAWLAALCVVLGLVTSVGVAWVGAWRTRFIDNLFPERWRVTTSQITVDLVGMVATNQIAVECIISSVVEVHPTPLRNYVRGDFFDDPISISPGAHPLRFERAVRRHEPLIRSPYGGTVEFSVLEAGWPWHCVSREEACTPKQLWGPGLTRIKVLDPSSGEIVDPAVRHNPSAHLRPHYGALHVGDMRLPCFPLWPGLLANTAFYGGAWAVLIGGPILLRRWLRARRGGCPQCGYSREGLKVDAPCPECGRASPAAHDATPTPTAR